MQLVGSSRPASSPTKPGQSQPRRRQSKPNYSQTGRPVPVQKLQHRAYPKRLASLRKTYRYAKYAVMAVVVLLGVIFSQDTGQVSAPSSSAVSNSTSTYTKAITARDIGIIDGDTIKIAGESRNVRLVGYNTPETYKPSCQRELDVGTRATQRLGVLISQANLIEFERVRCACKPGTEGTRECNFGRICGTLRTDGSDVGRTLISEGLAVSYQCGATSCPRRPGNWCG